MVFFKRQLPAIVVFVAGVAMAVLYYSPHPVAESFYDESSRWVRIIANCALLLGVVSLLTTHGRKIRTRTAGYGYSVVLIISFASIVVLGLFPWGWLSRQVGAATAWAGGIESGSAADWMFQNIKVPLESTMFSLLAFFIASAAYRAFRARSFEATIMLMTAIIMMIGRVPFGAVIPNPVAGKDPLLFEAADWLLSVPTNAAKRAIFLGIALSTIATSLRIIWGLERSYLGKGD